LFAPVLGFCQHHRHLLVASSHHLDPAKISNPKFPDPHQVCCFFAGKIKRNCKSLRGIVYTPPSTTTSILTTSRARRYCSRDFSFSPRRIHFVSSPSSPTTFDSCLRLSLCWILCVQGSTLCD